MSHKISFVAFVKDKILFRRFFNDIIIISFMTNHKILDALFRFDSWKQQSDPNLCSNTTQQLYLIAFTSFVSSSPKLPSMKLLVGQLPKIPDFCMKAVLDCPKMKKVQ